MCFENKIYLRFDVITKHQYAHEQSWSPRGSVWTSWRDDDLLFFRQTGTNRNKTLTKSLVILHLSHASWHVMWRKKYVLFQDFNIWQIQPQMNNNTWYNSLLRVWQVSYIYQLIEPPFTEIPWGYCCWYEMNVILEGRLSNSSLPIWFFWFLWTKRWRLLYSSCWASFRQAVLSFLFSFCFSLKRLVWANQVQVCVDSFFFMNFTAFIRRLFKATLCSNTTSDRMR